jgi:hypothetical protein
MDELQEVLELRMAQIDVAPMDPSPLTEDFHADSE